MFSFLYLFSVRFNKQALAIRERVLGGYHVDVARSLQALAVLHFSKGQYTGLLIFRVPYIRAQLLLRITRNTNESLVNT